MAAWTIFTDKEFVRNHHHSFEPEDIPRGALRWLVAEAGRVWREEKSLLTPDVVLLRAEVMNFEAWGTSKDEALGIYADIVESRTWSDDDAEALRVVARKWLRGLSLSRGIEEAAEALDAGDFDTAERTMSRSKHASAGFSPGMGWGPKHFPSQTRAVTTGVRKLDRWWLGGSHLGQLGFVLAPSNTGKSMLLPSFAAAALRRRMNVLYYTTELTEADVFKRVLSAINEEAINDIDDIPDAEARALARVQRSMLSDEGELDADVGFFEVRYRDAGSMTAADIAGDLDELRERGITIHLLIIDGDDLTLGGSDKKFEKFYEAYKEVYTQLSALAKTRQVVVWTAAQANKEGYKKAYLQGTHTADSLWKLRSADLALGMNITDETIDDQDRPFMQVSVIKDRYYGTKGRVLRLRPQFGLPGTPGIVGFENADEDPGDLEDDFEKAVRKAKADG